MNEFKRTWCQFDVWKYRILSIIRYLGDGMFYPFLSLYLKSTGLVEDRIGFITSLTPLLGILLNPLYSKICKNSVKTKNTLMIITCLEGLMIGIICFTSNFYLLTIIAILMAVFGSSHYGLMDSLITLYCDEKDIKYSSIRLFGSGAYIIATLLSGKLCNIDYTLAFHISGTLFIITGVLYFLVNVPDDGNIKNENGSEEEPMFKKYARLLTNINFVYFMLFYCIMNGIIRSSDNFFSIYLQTRGIDESGYGAVYAYFVAFEVVFLIILTLFVKKNVQPYLMLTVAAIGLFVRLLACYLYLPVGVVIALSGLRGIGYAIILHVTYQYIVDVVGKKDATVGIMLVTMAFSIVFFLMNNIDGKIIEATSYKTFYHINVVISVGLIIMALVKHIVDINNSRVYVLDEKEDEE